MDPSVEQAPAVHRSRRATLAVVGAIVVTVLGAALFLVTVLKAEQPPAVRTFDLGGTIIVRPHSGGKSCTGISGYDDLKPGASVTITDNSGKVVGVSRLGNGVESDINADMSACKFTFTVKDVPLGATVYGVEVGRRGKVQFSEADARDGKVKLQIGVL